MAVAAKAPSQSKKRFSVREISNVIEFACAKRKFGKDCCYIYIRGANEKSKVNVPEIMAIMEGAFAKDDVVLVENPDKNEVLVIGHVKEDACKGIINGTLYSKVSPHAVAASVYPLNERGQEQLLKILDGMIAQTDYIGRMAYMRYARKGNVFLVLDDDPMILRQMEHILKPFGHVETAAMAEEFLHKYKQFAPTAVYIDIHLKSEKGTDLAGALRVMLDPHAYTIIISSDTVKENILETKAKGANGFVGKPLNRDLIVRSAQAAPTFAVKK